MKVVSNNQNNSTMTVEELLKPRYKVIADWPSNTLSVGSVFIYYDSRTLVADGRIFYDEKNLSLYPHLFRKLEWWEERDIKDMPEYLIMQHATEPRIIKAVTHMVYATYGLGFINDKGRIKSYINYLPATEAEYNEYIKTKTPQP